MMEGLKHALETGLDKTMLEDQLKKSKVLLDKDWTKWDWETIREILEDSLENSARLSEALRGKFIKRLGGYFRCDPGEKGFFAHLEWTPKNILYTNCACRFYTVLLSHEEGKKFLKTDRRGAIFEEIAKELDSVLSNARDESLQNTSLVFHRDNAHRYMTREYFAILGRMWSTKGGKALQTLVNIFELFSELSKYQQLDYLSRVVLSNLDYLGQGYGGNNVIKSRTDLPRAYIQSALENSPSVSLRLHVICVLRTIARSRMKDFEWALDILVTRLHHREEDIEVITAVLSVLNEAADYLPYLTVLITKFPHQFIEHPTAEVLFAKFASLESGIEFLKTSEWFAKNVKLWQTTKAVGYVNGIETALADTLAEASSYGGSSVRIPLKAKEAIALQAQQGKLAGKELDLESLLRIPWTIDLLINQSRSPAAQGETVVLDTRIDVFYSDSEFSKLNGGLDNNCIVVTGQYVKPSGRKSYYKCSLQDVIHTSLSVGACPVKKNGVVGKPLRKWMRGGEERNSIGSPMSPTAGKGFHAFGRGRGDSAASMDSENSSYYRSEEADSADDVSSCDWTTCAFQGNKIIETKFNDGADLKIQIQGEPAVFYFKVQDPGADEMNTNNLYLSKVEYVIMLDPRKNAVKLPPHLFCELGRTEKGCEVLKEFKVVEGLRRVLEKSPRWNEEAQERATSNAERTVRFGSEEDKKEESTKEESTGDDEMSDDFRSALWSLANICVSEPGLCTVLEAYESFVPFVCKHAYSHPEYSMRGTCVCLLRLICECERGRQTCKEFGWITGKLGGVPIPENFSEFFKSDMNGWGGDLQFVGSPTKATQGGEANKASKGGAATKKSKIFAAIAKLGDHITAKEARQTLKSLRMDKSMVAEWESSEVREEIHRMLERYSFDLDSRRLVRQLLLEI
jgi:hypothetical protein